MSLTAVRHRIHDDGRGVGGRELLTSLYAF